MGYPLRCDRPPWVTPRFDAEILKSFQNPSLLIAHDPSARLADRPAVARGPCAPAVRRAPAAQHQPGAPLESGAQPAGATLPGSAARDALEGGRLAARVALLRVHAGPGHSAPSEEPEAFAAESWPPASGAAAVASVAGYARRR